MRDDHIDQHAERDFWGDEPWSPPRERRTRSHQIVTDERPADLELDTFDDDTFRDELSVGRVDPLVKRIGIMLLVAALLVPLALAFRNDEAPDQLRPVVDPAATTLAPQGAPAATIAPPPPPGGEGVGGAAARPVAAEQVASRPRVCRTGYVVRSGDFWIRIAKLHGITLRQLLTANNARATTPIFPGRTVCLPAGVQAVRATAKAAPSTTAPRQAPVAAAPTATTAAPAPVRSYTQDEVIAIIRQVWPDELEERAIQIAQRESKFQPTAKNWCCYGVFQMYWNVHSKWLGSIGITSANQLFDPVANVTAAYALYQRAGGWGPWT